MPVIPLLTRRPAIPIAVAFLLGLALERACLVGLASATLVAIAAVGTLAVATTMLLPPTRRHSLAVIAAAALALPAGALRERGPSSLPMTTLASWRESGRLERVARHAVQIRGRVRGIIRDDGATPPGCTFDVELSAIGLGRGSVPVRGRLILSAGAEAAPIIRSADRIVAWCRLRDPLDPCAGWRVDRQVITGRLTSARLIEPSGTPSPLRRLREHLRARLDEASRPGPGRGLARALVLGERDALDPDLVEGMAMAGTVHVLSVSGLHVALMGGLVSWLLGLLGARGRSAGLAGAATAWLFVLLAGFTIPAIRAAALLSVAMLGALLCRDVDRWNALAVSALVSASFAPREAFSLSFMLTFSACLGLVALLPGLREALPVTGPVALHAARDGIATGLAAWVGLLPAAATAFHRLQPLSALLNLVAIPLAAAATALSLLGGGLALLNARWAEPVLALVDLLARALDATDAPGLLADPRIATPSAALLVAWSLAAVVAAHARAARLRALSLLVLAFVLAMILMRDPRIERDVDASVSVLDVGQGQSVLVEIARPGLQPWRALIDAGGWPGSRFEVGERLVAPALWDRGIRRLDALVLTHADFDHRGGAPSVIRLMRPARLILSPVEARARSAFGPSIAAAESVGASVELAAAGSIVGPGGEVPRLRALWPPRDPAGRRGLSSNDAGLVLLLEQASGRGLALLPADIEARAESAVAADGLAPAPLLVLPHHGSRTSSTRGLLAGLQPRLALISAGRSNRFGHPHPTVVERLRAEGIATHLTAAEGSLRATFRGGLVEVTSCGCERTSLALAVSSAGEYPGNRPPPPSGVRHRPPERGEIHALQPPHGHEERHRRLGPRDHARPPRARRRVARPLVQARRHGRNRLP